MSEFQLKHPRQKFAAAVASGLRSDAEETTSLIEWLPLVLPLILGLPCFQPKSPAEKQEWIADHPTMARNECMRQLRRTQDGKQKRRTLRDTADQMIEEAVSMSPEAFAELCQ